MPTINVPGIGNVEKKYVYIGAAGIAGFAGFMFWRSKKASATDPNATDPNATDPNATGDPGTFDPNSSTPYDYTGSAPTYQAPYNQYIPWTSNQPVNTDAAWDSEVVAAASEMGADAGALASALGRFLANLCLTETQADLVRRAVGMFGRPPQSPNLSIKVCTATPGSTANKPTNFHVVSTDKASVTLSWNAVSGANYYMLHIDGGGTSHSVVTSKTTYRIGSLKHATTYHFNVRSMVNGVTSAATAPVTAKTK